MKRIVAVMLMVVMALSFFTISTAESGGYYWMVDSSNGVTIRDKPQGGVEIGTLRKGTVFRVIEEHQYRVGFLMDDGRIGYVHKEYCHIAHSEEIEEWQRKQREGIELTYEDCLFVGEIKEDCKVYREANGKIIGEFKAGDKVYIRKLGRYWYRIIYDNKLISYIQSSKVQLVDVNIPGDGEARVIKDGDDTSEGKFVIREQASTESKQVAKLNEGSYVKIISDDPDSSWVLVAYNVNGDMGYIGRKWLRKTGLFN